MASIWTMGEMLVEIMRPRPGMPLYEAGEFLGPFPSGAPAIFIDTVARLGYPAGIIGGVGADDFGRCLLERLNSNGVDCTYVMQMPHRSTAVAFVTYYHDGSRQFIFHIDGTPAVMAGHTSVETIQDPAYFHVMGCSLMANEDFRENIVRTMTSFHAKGAKISFDPNIRPELLGDRSLQEVVEPVLESCSVLFPGAAELNLLTGIPNLEDSVQQLFDAWPIEIIVVKRGKQGSIIFTPTNKLDVPVYPVKEIDPTGAGDCFDAAFLCGLLDNLPLDVCGKMASAAGALNAAAFGPMEGRISKANVAEVIQQGYVNH